MRNVRQRRMGVLRSVIAEYIETAKPVSSQTIAEKYGLDVSPATIRNDMMALEREGYLYHRHTSGGRVPTEKGYRFFVENLMKEAEVPVSQKRMIQHQFYQSSMEVEQWARLAAAVLARSTNCAGLATLPRVPRSCFKHVELISVRDSMVLLVLVLQGGTIRQQVLTLGHATTQEELTSVADQLNKQLCCLSSDEVERQLKEMSTFHRQIGQIVHKIMCRSEGSISERIYYEGLANILSAPEFSGGEKAHQVIAILEEGKVLPILSKTAEVGSVEVIITGERSHTFLRNTSLVLAHYGVPQQAIGVVGVIGPNRMRYSYTVSLVQYVASIMSEMMQNLYGETSL